MSTYPLVESTPMTPSNLRKAKLRKLMAKLWMYRYLYLLALPGVIYFLVFAYLPMWGVLIAFKDFRLFRGFAGSPWVGLDNFIFFFTSPNFFRLLRNTVIISGLQLVFVFPAPIILAILLNELRNGIFKRFAQTVSYLPHFISWVVIGGLLTYTFSQTMGVVNLWLQGLGLEPLHILGNKDAFYGLVVGTNIWKELGWGAIIYLAAITGINPELYEAATVDGANRFRRILHITLPGISSVIIIMLILQISSVLNTDFLQILILQGSDASLYEVGDVIDTWVYRAGFLKSQLSLATAVGVFKGMVGLILVLLANKAANAITGEGLWTRS